MFGGCREVLTRLGAKYDQYLDFRQQDAHELLRHLLDAMRMEEQDVCCRIKYCNCQLINLLIVYQEETTASS